MKNHSLIVQSMCSNTNEMQCLLMLSKSTILILVSKNTPYKLKDFSLIKLMAQYTSMVL